MTPSLLAFDTSTEHLSIALEVRGRLFLHEAVGGAKASSTLIPSILTLLAEAGTALHELDAIAFGRGPGAFTGLRTACSVAQGLALGAGLPALPIDTLMTVAEDARDTRRAVQRIWVAMDARMNEIYAARYAFDEGIWSVLDAPMLVTPEALDSRWRDEPPEAVAGTALGAFAGRLTTGDACLTPLALPRATAMLPLAHALWAAGGAVDAALALPVYLRDKVALTTVEREAVRWARQAQVPR